MLDLYGSYANYENSLLGNSQTLHPKIPVGQRTQIKFFIIGNHLRWLRVFGLRHPGSRWFGQPGVGELAVSRQKANDSKAAAGLSAMGSFP